MLGEAMTQRQPAAECMIVSVANDDRTQLDWIFPVDGPQLQLDTVAGMTICLVGQAERLATCGGLLTQTADVPPAAVAPQGW